LEECDPRAHLVLDGLEADQGVELLLELAQRAGGLRTSELVVHPVDERVAAARRDRDAVAQEPQATCDALDRIHRQSLPEPTRPKPAARQNPDTSVQPEQGETMTTLENRPNTALLVVDVQNGVVEGAPERDAVVANVGSLVERARREQVPVVWVQHSDKGLARGSDDWRIVPELTPDDAEPLVEKSYGDSFEDTTLETVLSGLGVVRLVVVGAQTDACIRSTLHGAFARGYDATLVSDAHTTEDQTAWGAPPPEQVIAHTNLYWTYQTAPGRTAGTVETKDVDFGGTS
jgi:isochorismate hydrolase